MEPKKTSLSLFRGLVCLLPFKGQEFLLVQIATDDLRTDEQLEVYRQGLERLIGKGRQLVLVRPLGEQGLTLVGSQPQFDPLRSIPPEVLSALDDWTDLSEMQIG